MTRKELINEIAYRLNITKTYAGDILKTYEDIIVDTLLSGEDIRQKDFLSYKIKTTGGTHRWSCHANGKIYVPLRYKVVVKPIGTFEKEIRAQPVSKLEQRRHNKTHRGCDEDGNSKT